LYISSLTQAGLQSTSITQTQPSPTTSQNITVQSSATLQIQTLIPTPSQVATTPIQPQISTTPSQIVTTPIQPQISTTPSQRVTNTIQSQISTTPSQITTNSIQPPILSIPSLIPTASSPTLNTQQRSTDFTFASAFENVALMNKQQAISNGRSQISAGNAASFVNDGFVPNAQSSQTLNAETQLTMNRQLDFGMNPPNSAAQPMSQAITVDSTSGPFLSAGETSIGATVNPFPSFQSVQPLSNGYPVSGQSLSSNIAPISQSSDIRPSLSFVNSVSPFFQTMSSEPTSQTPETSPSASTDVLNTVPLTPQVPIWIPPAVDLNMDSEQVMNSPSSGQESWSSISGPSALTVPQSQATLPNMNQLPVQPVIPTQWNAVPFFSNGLSTMDSQQTLNSPTNDAPQSSSDSRMSPTLFSAQSANEVILQDSVQQLANQILENQQPSIRNTVQSERGVRNDRGMVSTATIPNQSYQNFNNEPTFQYTGELMNPITGQQNS
jgi:hypothetical protein